MGRFVKTTRVPLHFGDDTVYIKDKMDWGTRKRLEGVLTRIDAATGEVRPDIGAYSIALMQEMIVGWEGPGFMDDETGKPVPCTHANILAFDKDDPVVGEVLNELGRRFPLTEEGEDEKKGDGTATSTGSKAT